KQSSVTTDLPSFPTRRSSDLSGLLATEHCPDKRLLYFKAGTQPADYCQDHLPDPDMEPTPVTEDSPGEESSWSRWLKWWNDEWRDRKSTRLNSSHVKISYAVF